MQVRAGLHTVGYYEVRSGLCPKCVTRFDDKTQAPQGDERYCPKCNTHRLGKVKQAGKVEGR